MAPFADFFLFNKEAQSVGSAMGTKHVSGVSAALVTPRNADDSVDAPSLAKLVRSLFTQGISSFAVNGATGEFCLTRPEHLEVILTAVRDGSDGQARILCGVGAASTSLAIELASVAQQHSVQGLLLPMPYFFAYEQQDLRLYCRTVAKTTELPILLYNLPQFASGLEKETVCELISDVPNIIGIKDSSGSLDIFRHLTEHSVDACRIVGNDSALAAALAEGVCDGVVSGVACAVPEIVLALYAERDRPDSQSFHRNSALLNQFIEKLSIFPTPWGIKWALEAREILPATFSQPVTTERMLQGEEMARWLRSWLPRVVSKEPEHAPRADAVAAPSKG